MAQPRYQVLGVGNALVDVIAQVDDSFLEQHGLARGTMTLIDSDRADALYDAMPPSVERSGGSCGNTMAALASLGGTGAYIGKVSSDQLGEVFRHDIRATGIAYDVPPAANSSTGRCLIMVTSDAQRTMQTYLGAASDLAGDDIDPDLVAAAQVTFLEGYLWDPPGAKEAFIKAAASAHAAGRKVSLTLSDPFCVERFRDEFVELVDNHIDILFANADEITSLYRLDRFEDAVERVRGRCEVAALTRSELGSVIVTSTETHKIAAERVGDVVDTTGAGDAYAAGVLYGMTSGRDLATAGRIASIAAAEVISHFGPRPEQSLADLVRARLGGD
jgi:sugar/nucleoside kinase (ribokinase family)